MADSAKFVCDVLDRASPNAEGLGQSQAAFAPCVWLRSGGTGTNTANASSWLILTGARRGEIGGIRWSEINLDKATWTLPAVPSHI
jgi:hypothetical protein